MVVGQQIALVLNKNTKPLFTVRLLFIFALAMVISSLYIDNHMDYIRALKMPEKLLNLSAFQAYVKEITSLTGVAVVLSGILYLRKSE
jgi:1,4-dihydroxy-2-naphthoate octaprenyltransferase